MGEHFFGNLSSAIMSVTVSRKRALQLIGGAMAVAVPARLPQAAEAARRRKPPLVFVSAVVTDVVAVGGNFPDFSWTVLPALFYPAENLSVSNNPQGVSLPANLPTDKVRAGIVAYLKQWAAQKLDEENAPPVSKDRIAVTLL